MARHGGEHALETAGARRIVGQHPRHHRIVVEGAPEHLGQHSDIRSAPGTDLDSNHPPTIAHGHAAAAAFGNIAATGSNQGEHNVIQITAIRSVYGGRETAYVLRLSARAGRRRTSPPHPPVQRRLPQKTSEPP
ncbi:hypothetical protein MLIT_07720 [Mycolicibacterium litorale]|uniref:Uncharacterized protein n=1 Tax=Mycolicibacterium litorale TaxID=758802 RepID=A0AAD1MRU6_9MYCO|nr:hypothetical protein MLIT_07720 [Mycolicibacterium litorale]